MVEYLIESESIGFETGLCGADMLTVVNTLAGCSLSLHASMSCSSILYSQMSCRIEFHLGASLRVVTTHNHSKVTGI